MRTFCTPPLSFGRAQSHQGNRSRQTSVRTCSRARFGTAVRCTTDAARAVHRLLTRAWPCWSLGDAQTALDCAVPDAQADIALGTAKCQDSWDAVHDRTTCVPRRLVLARLYQRIT
jgi:hypothetical protein